MENNKIKLTETDFLAISKNDKNYINNKGASLYCEPTYKESVEYYRLAAVMGSKHSISNLGYCYLYGRGMEANISLAIAYFKIASMKGDIDASYKLGDIYSSDKWGLKDNEMSVYYYRLAACDIIDDDWSEDNVFWTKKLSKYPSLCFALGRELLSGINMTRDIALSYIFLKHAFDGYAQELMNGAELYQSSFDNVKALLQDFRYDEVRDRIDKRFADPYDEDDDFDDEDDNDEIDEVIEDEDI